MGDRDRDRQNHGVYGKGPKSSKAKPQKNRGIKREKGLIGKIFLWFEKTQKDTRSV